MREDEPHAYWSTDTYSFWGHDLHLPKRGHLVKTNIIRPQPTSAVESTPLYTLSHSSKQAHDQHYHARHQSPPRLISSRLDHHDDTHVEMNL
jgi:hypothetical protein